MKLNQKGFGAVEGLLIVVALGIFGFGGYYVWNENHVSGDESTSLADISRNESDENNSNTEQDEEVLTNEDLISYLNEEFGFSFSYPSNLGAPEELTSEGYEGAGKSLSVTFEDNLWVVAHTEDYNIGPKGPIPFSSYISSGYEFRDGKVYLDGTLNEVDIIKDMGEYLYIENAILFQGDDNPVQHIAAFNTSVGGLVIYAERSDQVDIIKKLADTVNIL